MTIDGADASQNSVCSLEMAFCRRLFKQLEGNLNAINPQSIAMELPLTCSKVVDSSISGSTKKKYVFLQKTFVARDVAGTKWNPAAFRSQVTFGIPSLIRSMDSSGKEMQRKTREAEKRVKELQSMPYIEMSLIRQRMSDVKVSINNNKHDFEQFYHSLSELRPTDHVTDLRKPNLSKNQKVKVLQKQWNMRKAHPRVIASQMSGSRDSS
jgi:hypothetical protein